MIHPDAEQLRTLMVSPDWLRGQFLVALRDLEADAVTYANHPCDYTAAALASARRDLFRWLEEWMKAEQQRRDAE